MKEAEFLVDLLYGLGGWLGVIIAAFLVLMGFIGLFFCLGLIGKSWRNAACNRKSKI